MTNFDVDAAVKKIMAGRDAYYNKGRPDMTDQEYDALEETIRQFDPDHPIFEKIGHAPSSAWPEFKHRIAMGSLEKVHTKEDFLKWAKKFPNHSMCMQLKLDGLSASLEYEFGRFVRGITRGDGILGEDISPNIQIMRGFKSELPGFTGSVRAEIMLSLENFEKINTTLSERDQYSNPRNAAAGISRGLDGMYCKYLNLTFYDICGPGIDLDENVKIHYLQQMGLPIPICFTGTADYIVTEFEEFKTKRASLPFDIDGMVVKVCDKYVQKTLGSTKDGRPRAQKAWKFDPPGAATILNKVTWEVGRTGVVTPLGHVAPVKIEGSIIKKVTLHNIAEIKRLGIGLGDMVMLVKAGEIIPKIISVIEHKDSPIKIPELCPSCGSKLVNDEIRLMCMSDDCYAKNLTRVMNWIAVTEIDQFGEALAEELFFSGKINRIADLYSLTIDDISSIEGWGQNSATTIISNIEKSKNISQEKFLTAIGIPGISISTAEELLKVWKLNESPILFNATVDEIKALKGFSDISATNIVEGLKKYSSELNTLLGIIKFEPKTDTVQGKLSNLSFCFTGEMSHPRSWFQALVTKHGGKNSSTVTKDLSYLVCNENKGSSKSAKAEKYGVKVITETEFLGLIGEESQPVPSESKLVFQPLFEET
jgi:DNA ligase (NAD+)